MGTGVLQVILDQADERTTTWTETCRVPSSPSDLYPRMKAMQQAIGAQSFAILLARAATLVSPGALKIVMESPQSGQVSKAAAIAETHRHKLLSHLQKWPNPLTWDGASKSADAPCRGPGNVACNMDGARRTRINGAVVVPELGASVDVGGLAFPVKLGSMGNGYTLFLGPNLRIASDMLIDLHRKSYWVMREFFKLEVRAQPALEALNEREITCLQLVGKGMKSEAIGVEMGLSVHTVNAYLGSATTKLDAVNRIQAIAKAIRLGIIS